MKEPTKLDKWDSQFLYLAKGWFTHEQDIKNDEEDNEALCKIALHIWSDRCGVDIVYLHLGVIVGHLLKLCLKLGLAENDYNFLEFIENCGPYSKYDFNPKVKKEYSKNDYFKNVFLACLSFMRLLSVVDEEADIIISLEERDDKYKYKNILRIEEEKSNE